MQLAILLGIVALIVGLWIRNILINRKPVIRMIDTRPTPPTGPVTRCGVLHEVRNVTTESHFFEYITPADPVALKNVLIEPTQTAMVCVMLGTNIRWVDIQDAGPITSLNVECTE